MAELKNEYLGGDVMKPTWKLATPSTADVATSGLSIKAISCASNPFSIITGIIGAENSFSVNFYDCINHPITTLDNLIYNKGNFGKTISEQITHSFSGYFKATNPTDCPITRYSLVQELVDTPLSTDLASQITIN